MLDGSLFRRFHLQGSQYTSLNFGDMKIKPAHKMNSIKDFTDKVKSIHALDKAVTKKKRPEARRKD